MTDAENDETTPNDQAHSATDAAPPHAPPPDRLSVDPTSAYYDADVLSRDVGVRFKGADRTNVEEYCVSEGWIRVTLPSKDRRGNPLSLKISGPVEPYYRTRP